MTQHAATGAESARGDLTRNRLLDAATEIFAHNAYDSVRTRTLAEAAGANQAAIPYYFGGKEGLYLAVAERIAQELRQRTQALTDQVEEVLKRRPPISRQEVRDTLGELLAGYARAMLGRPVSSTQTAFIVQEQLRPSAAFDALYREAMEPLHRALTALLARLLGLAEDDPRCILQAHAMLSQILGFVVTRSTLLRRLGQERLEPQQAEYVVELIEHFCLAPFAHDDGRENRDSLS